MIRKFMALAVAGAAALAVTVSASAVPCCMTNGSFETGDLTGWTSSGGGFSTGVSGGGAPGQGSWFGGANASTSSNVFGGVSQTAFGPAGRIFGWARFIDGEVPSCPDGDIGIDDQARVMVGGVVVFSASSNTTSTTGWTPWSVQVNSTGARAVAAQVQNTSDSACDSEIHIDGVTWDARLTKLPPP
jgi:hypothetical protein